MKNLLPLLLLAVVLPHPANAARAFIVDKVSAKVNPSDIDWPSGPVGFFAKFDAAVIIAAVPGKPGFFVWDVLASPQVITILKNHYPAAGFLGQKYSDLRALAATKPILIGAIFRKQVQRMVVVNGKSTAISVIVPQSDITIGDVKINHEVPANRWFGVVDGED